MKIPYELFWKLNPRKLKPFEKAKKMELDAIQARINLTGWITGTYVMHAVAACFSKSARYPQKPLDFFGTEGKATPQQEAQMFENFMYQHNAQKEVSQIHNVAAK